MTNQHRATPEQISMCVYPGDLATDPRKVAVVINALSDRIEALEAAQLEQADSNRFCTDAIVRRVEALEATQHAHADVSHLNDADREQVAQELAKPAAWRPLEPDSVQAIPPSPTASDQDLIRAWHSVPGEGFTPALRAVYDLGRQHGSDAKQGAAPATAMAELRAASAEARPAELVERVARSIERTVDFNPDSYAPEARAAIREVAAWLRDNDRADLAGWLEQEANQ